MKPRMLELLHTMQRYNSTSMAHEVFGLDASVTYDALVVAPSWKPDRIIKDPSFTVTVLANHSYVSGYLVEKDGLKIAWIQCASGACNLIDHLFICAELRFKKLIFIGAVGSLVSAFNVGDFCTPAWSIDGALSSSYLSERLSDYRPFAHIVPPDPAFVERVSALAAAMGYPLRPSAVFCTDSISLEYAHLDEIKSMGAQLIEMETAAFYRLADLLEIPAVALLVVSDNSANGDPLLGRSPELDDKYHNARNIVIPQMIEAIARLD